MNVISFCNKRPLKVTSKLFYRVHDAISGKRSLEKENSFYSAKDNQPFQHQYRFYCNEKRDTVL